MVFLSHRSYAKWWKGLILSEAKKCATPLEANIKLRRGGGNLLDDTQPYRALVGSLIYLTITRPNIFFSVGLVSQFMQEPRKPHFDAAKHILKYVLSTLEMGLKFKKKLVLVCMAMLTL